MDSIFKRFRNLEVWEKNLAVLWVGAVLTCASYTMVIPFLPIYLMQELSVPKSDVNFWSGITFSITFFFGMVMAPYWGARADKYGRKSMIMRAGVSLGIVYILSGLVRNEYELLVVRACHGIVSGFIPGSLSLLASTLPKDRSGWGLGLMQAGIAAGTIMGTLFGASLADIFGMRGSFIIAGINIMFATLAVKYWVYEEVVPKTSKKKSSFAADIRIAFHNKALLHMLIMFVVVQSCSLLLQPLITLHVGNLMGGNMSGAVFASGVVFSLAGVSGVIASTYWGTLGSKRGYLPILVLVLFGAGVTISLQAFVKNIWLFGTIQFIYGIFIAGTAPSINATIVDYTRAGFRGRAFGLATSFQQMGSMIGPLLGGAVGSFLDIQYVFLVAGVMLIAAAWSIRERSWGIKSSV